MYASKETFITRPPQSYDVPIHSGGFVGCPTIAATKKGRLFLGWYTGGDTEPHIDNYGVIVYSDDGGKTLSKPIFVINGSREKYVHMVDPQLWFDGEKLHLFFMQDDVMDESTARADAAWGVQNGGNVIYCYPIRDGYAFRDFWHSLWECVCENPDDENPVFSEPKFISSGFLRNKPLALRSGKVMLFNYRQTTDRYAFTIKSGDRLISKLGPKKIRTCFDEAMAYQKEDGSIRLMARNCLGEIAETTSVDEGETWSEAKLSGIPNPDTRFYVSRTPSGKVLLINNDVRAHRINMTAYLSDDDGKTWKYKALIDPRNEVSYPDADFVGEDIYTIYDRERTGAKEILLAKFTEDDLMQGKPIEPWVIAKP